MKFKLSTITLTCFFALLVLVQSSNAQMKKTMTFSADEPITIVAGLNAIIKGGEKGLIIEMVPPKGQRPKAYKNVDLANQDKIIMCNGKKVKSIDDLNAAIEAVKVGDDVSFGIKRGNEMMIVSFPKADAAAGGGNMMMMTTTIDGDGTVDEKTSMNMNGVQMKDVVMVEAGMIIKDVDGKINILALLPNLIDIIDGEKPTQGDIVISINGKKDLNAEEFNKEYNALKLDDSITITFSRDSKEFSFTFKKPAVDDSGTEVIMHK